MRRIRKLGFEHKALIALAVTLPLSALADDPTINRMLASQCSQCHGTNGYAVSGIDSLAGESAREIREEMDEMQLEGTPDEMMDHQALGYSDDQIRRIAAYFAALPENPPAGTKTIELVAGDVGGGGASQDEDHEDRDDEDRDQDRDEDRDHDQDEDRHDEDGDDHEDEDDEDEDEEDEDRHEDEREH
ncbi:hypothetical protein NOR53_1406 [gamma proteobacterium NOR5-3]|nr:hypothetical protein NOR53_1406 [gamma proteobacterium NOR5-3]